MHARPGRACTQLVYGKSKGEKKDACIPKKDACTKKKDADHARSSNMGKMKDEQATRVSSPELPARYNKYSRKGMKGWFIQDSQKK